MPSNHHDGGMNDQMSWQKRSGQADGGEGEERTKLQQNGHHQDEIGKKTFIELL